MASKTECNSDADIKILLNEIGVDGNDMGKYHLKDASEGCIKCVGESGTDSDDASEVIHTFYGCLPDVSQKMCSRDAIEDIQTTSVPVPKDPKCSLCFNKFKFTELQKVCSDDDFKSVIKLSRCWQDHGSDIMDRLDGACGDPDNPVATPTRTGGIIGLVIIVVIVIIIICIIYHFMSGKSDTKETLTAGGMNGGKTRRYRR
jgi:hypothetical protein